ncbi:MAG: GTPase Era [Proteobacteria bacterium]|nr:GTPase Era [Pseudomonadota bacterium]
MSKPETGKMRCALVALVGLPNVGKSTLLNALVGEKVGIVSDKPNTTRVTVRGVFTQGETQFVFMDTPGLNRSSKAFDRRLVQQAEGAGQEADIVVFLVDVGGIKGGKEGLSPAIVRQKEMLEQQFRPMQRQNKRQKLLVVLTKVDKVKDKTLLLPVLTEVGSWGVDGVVPLSAEKHDGGLKALLNELDRMTGEGPWLFPAGQVTDMPMPLRLAEITREKAMRLLYEEVPYGVGVVTEQVEDRRNEERGTRNEEEAPMLVQQQILVAREQHKAMVVGKGGQMLKKIGMQARAEMQEILGCGVRLELHVKVAERWAEREEWLREMGV